MGSGQDRQYGKRDEKGGGPERRRKGGGRGGHDGGRMRNMGELRRDPETGVYRADK
jgi:hypothetical protein